MTGSAAIAHTVLAAEAGRARPAAIRGPQHNGSGCMLLSGGATAQAPVEDELEPGAAASSQWDSVLAQRRACANTKIDCR